MLLSWSWTFHRGVAWTGWNVIFLTTAINTRWRLWLMSACTFTLCTIKVYFLSRFMICPLLFSYVYLAIVHTWSMHAILCVLLQHKRELSDGEKSNLSVVHSYSLYRKNYLNNNWAKVSLHFFFKFSLHKCHVKGQTVIRFLKITSVVRDDCNERYSCFSFNWGNNPTVLSAD